MNLSRKIAHNTLIQIVGKIISTVLGLLALAMITRYLGQDGFGEYTTITTFLTFFAVIADLGLTLVTVQMISGEKNPVEENKILNNLFSLRLVSVLIFISLAPIFVLFMPYSQTIKIGVLIASLSFIFPALNQIIIGLLQKRLSMDRASLAEIISRVALLIGIILVARNQTGLNGVLVVTVLAGAINFIFHYLFSRKFAKIRLQISFSLWKKIFSKSWPLAITIVLNLIYLRADVLILSLYQSSSAVGLYGATYKVIDVLTSIPFMFAGLILPILTAAWLENKTDYFKTVLQKSFDFMAIIAIPLIVGAQFLAKPIMVYIAGQDFIESGIILKYLIVSVAAIFLGTMFSHAVIALDKQKKLIGFYIFTSISALAAYFIFIPKFSYLGAASVTIYSEIAIGLFSAYCVYKYSRFLPNLKTTIKSLGAALLMGVFLYFSPEQYQTKLTSLLIIIVLASLIYFVALYFLGGVSAKDLKSIFKKSNKGGAQTYDPTSNL